MEPDSLGCGQCYRADVALLNGSQMRSEHRQYMVDGRNAHHDVQDRQIRTTEYGSQKVDPKAGQRKMKPAKNNEKQRNHMNHFHNNNLTLSEDYPHLQCNRNCTKNQQDSSPQRTIAVQCSTPKMQYKCCSAMIVMLQP
jgi:hypothetical protein